MPINWEARRRRIRQWYELVERCRATLAGSPGLDGPAAVALLLARHPELKDAGEARKALDYIAGRKGNPRTLPILRGES